MERLAWDADERNIISVAMWTVVSFNSLHMVPHPYKPVLIFLC